MNEIVEVTLEFYNGQVIFATGKNSPNKKYKGVITILDGNVFVLHNTPIKNVIIERIEDFIKNS